jgi:hypothetical protein
MYSSNFDWRDEPRRVSAYSLSLLLVFVAAAGLILWYIVAVVAPSDGAVSDAMDARTYADRGLTPLPPEQVNQPQ